MSETIAPAVPPSIDTIKRLCAAHFGVTETDLISARRDKQTVVARHAAILLAREMTGHSMPVIGRLFGNRDHTTILSAVRSMQDRIRNDPTVAESVNDLRQLLRPTEDTPRFYVGWRHAGTGTRGAGGVALRANIAMPLLARLRAENTGNYAYELVAAAEIEAWKGQAHGQASE